MKRKYNLEDTFFSDICKLHILNSFIISWKIYEKDFHFFFSFTKKSNGDFGSVIKTYIRKLFKDFPTALFLFPLKIEELFRKNATPFQNFESFYLEVDYLHFGIIQHKFSNFIKYYKSSYSIYLFYHCLYIKL